MVGRPFRGLSRGEEGQALVVALVVMSALTISIAGIITFMGSHEASTGRDRQVVRSLGGAEAGLSNGFSYIVQHDPTNNLGTYPVNVTLGPFTTNVDGSQVEYRMTKSYDATAAPPTYVWTVTSTSTQGNVTRQVSQQINYIQGAHQDASQVYKYGLFIGAPAPGTNPTCLFSFGGGITVKTNVYIGGNLCTNGGHGGSSIQPPSPGTLEFYVKGYWDGKGSGSIGTAAFPFAIARIQGGCLNNQGNSVICSNRTNVFATDTNTSPFPVLQKPTVHGDVVYNGAASWVGKCTGAFQLDGAPGVMDQSLGQQNLFPNSSYSCTVPKLDGSTATMTWNNSTRTFNIVGSIFVDGSVQLNPQGSGDVNWTGNGSIYVNGVLSNSNFNLCGPPKAGSAATGFGCPKTWDTTLVNTTGWLTAGSTTVTGLPTTSNLVVGMYVNGTGVPIGTTIAAIPNSTTITLSAAATATSTTTPTALAFDFSNFGFVVLNPGNVTNAFDGSANGEIDADMYLVNGFSNTGGTVVTGSVVADGGNINGGTGFLYPQTAPPDFPVTYDTPDVGWVAAPSTWRQLK